MVMAGRKACASAALHYTGFTELKPSFPSLLHFMCQGASGAEALVHFEIAVPCLHAVKMRAPVGAAVAAPALEVCHH